MCVNRSRIEKAGGMTIFDLTQFRFSDLLRRVYAVYQPVVDTRKGLRPHFYETLARIDGDTLGILHSGVIHRLDMSMLKKALKQLEAAPEIVLSINVSPITIDLAGRQILELLGYHTGVSNRLIIELNDPYFIARSKECLQVLDACRELGLRIAVDDFGYGADMQELEVVQPDIVKLHASAFNDAMLKADFSVLNTAMDYAWSRDIMLVAKSVDSHEKMIFMADQGIRMMQGYLFSRPVRMPPCSSGWPEQPVSKTSMN